MLFSELNIQIVTYKTIIRFIGILGSLSDIMDPWKEMNILNCWSKIFA